MARAPRSPSAPCPRAWAVLVVSVLFLAQGCGEEPSPGENTPRPFDGPTWGAECRPFPPSAQIIPLDDEGTVIFAGSHGPFLGGADSAYPSITHDGGATWRPVLEPYNAHRNERTFIRSFGAWSIGGVLFVAVGPPDRDGLLSDEVDWMVVSDDGGASFDRRMAEFGRFPIADRVEAQRLWTVGDAQLANANGEYYASVDGGSTWAPAPRPPEPPDEGWAQELERLPGEPASVILRRGERGLAVRLAFDGALTAMGVETAVDLGESLLLFVARVEPTERHRSRLLCRAAPAIDPSLLGAMPPKALGEVVPDELALHARVDYADARFAEHLSQIAIAKTGKIYTTNGAMVGIGAHRPASILPIAFDADGEFLEAFSAVDSVLWPAELSVYAIVQSDWDRRLGGWDSRAGAPIVQDAFAGMRAFGTNSTTPFGRPSSTANVNVIVRGETTLHLAPNLATDPSDASATVIPGRTFLSGRTMILAGTQAHGGEDTALLVVDGVNHARLPDIRDCFSEPAREGCIVLEDRAIAVALADRDGRIYALDHERRELLRESATAPGEFEVFVDGLHRPTDFEIVTLGTRSFALILDIDVLAIDLETEGRVTRSHP